MAICQRCGGQIALLARSDARFCSVRCRVAAHRAKSVFPAEMTCRRSWVRAEHKRPITVAGRPASSTDSETWSSFKQVVASRAGDGFGIMLGEGLGCYDLDHMSDVEVRRFTASICEPVIYAERSMSGDGVHVFVLASEGPGSRRAGVERYTRARFIRVTGRRFDLGR